MDGPVPDVHQIGEPALLVHEKDRSAAVAESVQRLQSGQLDAECESLGGRVADPRGWSVALREPVPMISVPVVTRRFS